MKKIFKITGIVLGVALVLLIIVGIVGYSRMSGKAKDSYAKLGERALELNTNGFNFRDLNSVFTGQWSKFTINTSSSSFKVWDISDRHSPKIVVGSFLANDFSL